MDRATFKIARWGKSRFAAGRWGSRGGKGGATRCRLANRTGATRRESAAARFGHSSLWLHRICGPRFRDHAFSGSVRVASDSALGGKLRSCVETERAEGSLAEGGAGSFGAERPESNRGPVFGSSWLRRKYISTYQDRLIYYESSFIFLLR